MKLDRYKFKSGNNLLTYEFLSEGIRGEIPKLIQFTLVSQNSLYNLAFGDKNSDTGEIDDRVVAGNDDSEKVLATAVAAVYAFCDQFPHAWIYATGSTKARTRLYRISINKYSDTVQEDFEIFGLTESGWKRFVKGADHRAFAI